MCGFQLDLLAYLAQYVYSYILTECIAKRRLAPQTAEQRKITATDARYGSLRRIRTKRPANESPRACCVVRSCGPGMNFPHERHSARAGCARPCNAQVRAAPCKCHDSSGKRRRPYLSICGLSKLRSAESLTVIASSVQLPLQLRESIMATQLQEFAWCTTAHARVSSTCRGYNKITFGKSAHRGGGMPVAVPLASIDSFSSSFTETFSGPRSVAVPEVPVVTCSRLPQGNAHADWTHRTPLSHVPWCECTDTLTLRERVPCSCY